MWICRRLFGHYWPGITATGPNVPLPCHDTCQEPLHTLAALEVILASVTCSASWLTRTHLPQDSPLHSLTQDDTNSDAVICWCYLIVAKNCLQTSPRKWIGELRIHYIVFLWSGSLKVNFTPSTFTFDLIWINFGKQLLNCTNNKRNKNKMLNNFKYSFGSFLISFLPYTWKLNLFANV